MSTAHSSSTSRGPLDQRGPAPGRAAARLARVVENALADVELSLPQYRLLAFLAEGGTEAASALAGMIGVSRPSVTALVDGLVARGMVERSPHPTDRRRVAHNLTACGQEALAAADTAVEARLVDTAGWLSDSRSRKLAFQGLLQWEAALNRQREARLAEQ